MIAMEKNQFKQLFRSAVKSYGFQCRGNYCFKIEGEDYLIGIWLDHHPFEKAFFVEYGVVYDFNKSQLPFKGRCDWRMNFLFPRTSGSIFDEHSVKELNYGIDRVNAVDWFDYEALSSEDFLSAMSINMKKKIAPLYDKEYVLNLYRNNWILFRMIPYDSVRKISRLANLDPDEVIRIRDSRITKWP